MEFHTDQAKLKRWLRSKAHLITLSAGLLNLALLPLWRIPVRRSLTDAIGWPLFASGLVLTLLSTLALGGGGSGSVEPVRGLTTRGIYALERHPVYLGFVLIMLGLDVQFCSLSAGLGSIIVLLPVLIWRARLEEQALNHHFGSDWLSYASRVPSFLLGDCRPRARARAAGVNRTRITEADEQVTGK